MPRLALSRGLRQFVARSLKLGQDRLAERLSVLPIPRFLVQFLQHINLGCSRVLRQKNGNFPNPLRTIPVSSRNYAQKPLKSASKIFKTRFLKINRPGYASSKCQLNGMIREPIAGFRFSSCHGPSLTVVQKTKIAGLNWRFWCKDRQDFSTIGVLFEFRITIDSKFSIFQNPYIRTRRKHS